jgi:hypothetical protein
MTTAAACTPHLLNLPIELLEQISTFLTPGDITRLGQTCHKALDLIAPNNLILWQDACLREFDDPHNRWASLLPSATDAVRARERQWDWYGELRRRLSALRAIDRLFLNDEKPDYDEIVETVLDIIDTAATTLMSQQPATGHKLYVTSESTRNISKLCPTGRFSPKLDKLIDTYQTSCSPSAPEIELPSLRHYYTRSVARSHPHHRPDSISRLHVLYGLTTRELGNEDRGPARRLTYDWHLTGPSSDHGPYHLDGSGRINWQLLEAVCTVIGRNVQQCIEGSLIFPQELRCNLPYRTLPDATVPHDWARVTGTWVGTYSFIDYHDLFYYNVGYAPGRRPSLDDELEACGDLMRLELQLDDSDMIKNDWRLKSDLPVCEDLPILYFSGNSRGHSGPPRPSISVRGRVSLVPGAKEVRWRYLIK